ncbi:MAG TPA: DUF3307 domain-containing protein [Flavobacterium sp.]|jgi:hypothetical protein
MIVFVKLLLAHLLGDFLLQPNSWVLHKEEKKHKSIFLLYHILIHGALAWILIADFEFMFYAVALALIHGLIDVLKLHMQQKGRRKAKTKRIWFVLDQLLHMASIAGIALLWTGTDLNNYSMDNRAWIAATAIFLLTTPASIIIKNVISIWTPDNKESKEDLENAGKYIGILERLFIFGFIVSGHFEAIGFLLAAKSIFRFGDLTQSKDRKLTEYVLIGTLISFGFAILTGYLFNYALTLL